MDTLVLTVFALVYLGMILGRIPGLALDRTGVALLGAIALFAFGRIGTDDLPAAVDVSTIALLFALMVVSSQFRLAGAYSYLVRRVGRLDVSPTMLLGLVIGVVALLSAVLVNDIVCLAATPVVIEACANRRLNPVPFLLAVACASNIGSAATLIGNPQNILIGQVLDLSFSGYLLESVVPVLLGLVLLWGIVAAQYRDNMTAAESTRPIEQIVFDRWQTAKGTVVLFALLTVFLIGGLPRDLAALAGAGILLLSRRMHSRDMLGLVDWQLLVLFFALFVVNYTVNAAGYTAEVIASLGQSGVDLTHPGWLFGASVVLSNLVSNVPATMLLLPSATHPISGAVLALSSTLAGNLIVVGSIANIIVLDQASRLGVKVSWRTHAKTGVPVTVATLLVAGIWLWVRGG